MKRRNLFEFFLAASCLPFHQGMAAEVTTSRPAGWVPGQMNGKAAGKIKSTSLAQSLGLKRETKEGSSTNGHQTPSDISNNNPRIQTEVPTKVSINNSHEILTPDQDYLSQWMDQPRYPMWNPRQNLARGLVIAIRCNHPCVFYYHGGNTPGAKRTVIPAEVFSVGDSDTLYLAGWCMNKQAHRTFRIDRIELA